VLDDVFQLQLWGKSSEEGGVDLIPEAQILGRKRGDSSVRSHQGEADPGCEAGNSAEPCM